MNDLTMQTEIERAIDAFKAEKFVEMSPLELSKVIELDLDIFDDSCQFFFLRSSLKAIEYGKLTVIFQKRKKSLEKKVSNSSIYIGSRAGHINIYCRGRNTCLVFGKDTRLGKNPEKSFEIRLSGNSTLLIGDETTCNSAQLHASNCYIKLGRDCMLSSEIIIQGSDGHGIIDLKEGRIVNNDRRLIDIGEHVWLGRRVIILPDIKIGAGSVIGTGAIVARDIEPMSVAVGTPARVVKTDCTWSREVKELDEYSRLAISSYKVKISPEKSLSVAIDIPGLS
jgi:acetyltransferase-like isoleucine patch superfamily enzyme